MLNRRRVGRETHREDRCWLPRGWKKCDPVTSTLILGWWLYPCSGGQQKTFNRQPTYVSVNLQSGIELLLPGSVPKEKGKPLPPKKKNHPSQFSIPRFLNYRRSGPSHIAPILPGLRLPLLWRSPLPGPEQLGFSGSGSRPSPAFSSSISSQSHILTSTWNSF